MICRHYYLKNNFVYKTYIGNKCHNFPMSVIDLNEFFIWNNYRGLLAINILKTVI